MGFKFNPLTAELDMVGNSTVAPTVDISANIENVILDSNTSALRAVYSNGVSVDIADNALFTTAQVYGITIQGGSAGNSVKVITAGHLQDSSFNFTPNEIVFLGSNGVITNMPPVSGVQSVIGLATKIDTIFVRISVPIQL